MFNDQGVTDHFAIMPTGMKSENLAQEVGRVYDLVVRRFLSAFFPEAVWENVERITRHDLKTPLTAAQDRPAALQPSAVTANPGLAEHPLATLERARDVLRELRQQGKLAQGGRKQSKAHR